MAKVTGTYKRGKNNGIDHAEGRQSHGGMERQVGLCAAI